MSWCLSFCSYIKTILFCNNDKIESKYIIVMYSYTFISTNILTTIILNYLCV